jgi:hypothetical protein
MSSVLTTEDTEDAEERTLSFFHPSTPVGPILACEKTTFDGYRNVQRIVGGRAGFNLRVLRGGDGYRPLDRPCRIREISWMSLA